MGKKYFFKTPYRGDVYISLRLESKKFMKSKDFIIATEPLTLKEYYTAFILGIPFRAYVRDRVELVVPDDLDGIAAVAKKACRGVRRIFLSWWTIDREDLNAAEEAEIWGNFARRGVNEMLIRGYGEVEAPYVCEDPDDCMWPNTLLTYIYEAAYKYKEWQYRGGDPVYGGEHTAKLIAELFSDPKNTHTVFIHDADVDEIERLLKKKGFAVLRRCEKSKARIQIEVSEGRLLIEC
jgi:hypothetical protein